MKLGFIGTGHITAAIVTGMSTSFDSGHDLVLSPRGADVGKDLARRFPRVTVASSNQEVLDRCEAVVIAVRPPITRSVLSALRFRAEHRVISVVSSVSVGTLRELVAPATHIVRAVPLPSVAKRVGPTAIYPADPQVESLFGAIGPVEVANTEDGFDAICAATGTVAAFYAYLDAIASWLSRAGVKEGSAREYMAQVFRGVMEEAIDEPARSFDSLARAHSTPGGINEMFLKRLNDAGLTAAVPEALDALREKIRNASRG